MCLICGGRIEDGAATRSDGVAFDCVKHGAYSVARTALPRFVKLASDAQSAALERAKIFAPQRRGEIVITTLDL
jgi:hypothetical protein